MAGCAVGANRQREHRRGSVFWPRRGILPDTEVFVPLRLSFITQPVALLRIQHLQTLQVLL